MAICRTLLLSLLASAWVLAHALEEPPRSLVAVEGPEPELRHQRQINGCAVLITSDGLAITLAETVPSGQSTVTVILPGGDRREAAVLASNLPSTAVLLRIPLEPGDPVEPIELAASGPVAIGDVVWSAGNSYGALEDDGVAMISRGIISGRYEIPPGHPPIRGRHGAILTEYRGPVLETDAAVNDGDHGGALVDNAGRLVGLLSLGVVRQRRMGTAVPIDRILGDLKDTIGEMAQHVPVGPDPLSATMTTHAESLAASLVLVYLERPQGPGNPEGMPRPRPISPTLPRYEQERLSEQWSQYYHQQQVFFTDQAVTTLCIDASRGLLLTAASNLHGDAESGFALLNDGTNVRCQVHARHAQLDLAVLICEQPLDIPAVSFDANPDIHSGDPVAVLGRHRDGGPFTMTTGIISAVDRRFDLSPFALLQTDALANYGSLGGVIMDLDGKAIGMITMLAPNPEWRWFINSGVAMGVNAATLTEVLPALMDGESDLQERRFFGLGVTTEWIEDTKQTRVTAIIGGGAADSDLQVGDSIIEADGQRLEYPTDLKRVVLTHKPNDLIELTVLRGEETLRIPVELRVIEP